MNASLRRLSSAGVRGQQQSPVSVVAARAAGVHQWVLLLVRQTIQSTERSSALFVRCRPAWLGDGYAAVNVACVFVKKSAKPHKSAFNLQSSYTLRCIFIFVLPFIAIDSKKQKDRQLPNE